VAKSATSGTVYYHRDGLGSTVALSDATGQIVERYRYDVFDRVEIRSATGESVPVSLFGNRFHFTGREWLSEVGLYDYRNRVYSAELGRFLQTDPIRFSAGDGNLYRYVGNNPVNLYDPYGLFSFDDVSNFSAGWGDTLTTIPFTDFSLTRETRNSLPGIYGDNGGVDRCSSAYGAGEWGGIANSLALGGKGLGNLASRIGNQSTRSRLYEIGQRTLTSGEYGKYSGIADPVRRGIAMVRDGASGAPSLSGMLTQSWKTIGTGLTPQAAASLGDIGAGFGGAAVGGTGLGNKAN
jgi:RHS repeat-associated protein